MTTPHTPHAPATYVRRAIDAYHDLEKMACRNDVDGRPVGLRLEQQDDGARFDIFNGDHRVAQARLEQTGDHLICSIAPVDDSYGDELRQLVKRLPGWWVYEKVGGRS